MQNTKSKHNYTTNSSTNKKTQTNRQE